jgi:hypothetical protein
MHSKIRYDEWKRKYFGFAWKVNRASDINGSMYGFFYYGTARALCIFIRRRKALQSTDTVCAR